MKFQEATFLKIITFNLIFIRMKNKKQFFVYKNVILVLNFE